MGHLASQLTGGPVDARLCRHAFQLLRDEETEVELLLHLLETSRRERRLEDCASNREWLERARAEGVNIEAWLQGFSVEADVEGSRVRLHTETDPVEVLRMGT